MSVKAVVLPFLGWPTLIAPKNLAVESFCFGQIVNWKSIMKCCIEMDPAFFRRKIIICGCGQNYFHSAEWKLHDEGFFRWAFHKKKLFFVTNGGNRTYVSQALGRPILSIFPRMMKQTCSSWTEEQRDFPKLRETHRPSFRALTRKLKKGDY